MKYLLTTLMFFLFQGCAPSIDALQVGDNDGMAAQVYARNYDHVWYAVNRAMSNGFTIMQSQKQAGVIKGKYKNEDRIIAIFISPTDPNAHHFEVNMVTRRPMQYGPTDRWDPQLMDSINNELKR